MHLDGQFTINAPREDVYAFLTDPATVSRHMPDVKHVVIEDADRFTVTARVGVSHIKGDVVMKLTIKDRQPPISTTVVGQGTGLGSAVDMVTSFTLDETADGTVVHWRGDVTISGRLAAFGPQGLLDRIGRKNVDTFIEGLRAGLAEKASSRQD
jgi:carbon monoxide dehydrogenase subunit G